VAGSAKKRVLAVASGGGHWIQLQRMRPAFEHHACTYVSTLRSYGKEITSAKFYFVHDATRWNKLGLVLLAFQMLLILVRERPNVVISTGAAPGYFALLFGKLLGARTIWVDSIANSGELSLSGRMVSRFADLWLTQWEHLATPDGPTYSGSVL